MKDKRINIMAVNKTKRKLSRNQNGLVSIIITMLLMIVITLVVIGFAKLTRRDQRQVLDRQLSTQAFYAAESGINDALKVLQTPSATGVPTKTTCQPDANFTDSGVLDAANNVAYTCLLVNPTPSSLKYDTIDTQKSTTIPINSATNPINSITLSWEVTPAPTGATSTASCPAAGKLPAYSAYSANCDAGMLRVDLVPSSGAISRSGLNNATFTAIFQPGSGTGIVSYSKQGDIVQARCTGGSTPVCTATINNLNAMNYTMRIRSLYKSNSLIVTANNTASGALSLVGAQVSIDATGKANDVLRRVVVRAKISPNTDVPDFAIQSKDSICKRFYAYSGQASYDSTNAPSISGTNAGGVCDPTQP